MIIIYDMFKNLQITYFHPIILNFENRNIAGVLLDQDKRDAINKIQLIFYKET
jgi:hypothetical protein